jgi:hypothetical protein
MKPGPSSFFVWGLWAAMTVALFWFVAHTAEDVPITDDWSLVPILTGERTADAAWFWEQHNEHRIPIPKALHLMLARLSNTDYRAGMYLNCALLALGTALLLVMARRLRGPTSFFDAFFPLALMHWGQAQNLLWSFQIQFICSAFLSLVILATIVASSGLPSARSTLIFALCLLALPLTGANGVALVPALALWMMYVGWLAWRKSQRRQAAVFWGIAVASLLLVGVYFAGYAGVQRHGEAPSPRAVVETATRFLAMAVGMPGGFAWPLPGIVAVLAICAVLVFLVCVLRRQPQEQPRALGLILFIGAILSLALGFGWGRSALMADESWAARNTRYITLAAPLLCAFYFAGELYLPRAVPRVLCVLMLVLLIPNTLYGLERAHNRQTLMHMLEKDIRKGKTPEELGKKYKPLLFDNESPEDAAERFEMLQRAHQGPYRHWTEEVRENSLPEHPGAGNAVDGQTDTRKR